MYNIVRIATNHSNRIKFFIKPLETAFNEFFTAINFRFKDMMLGYVSNITPIKSKQFSKYKRQTYLTVHFEILNDA